MGYNEFDELGDKIQSIIDSAVNEKNYQKLSQSINQALNKAIDNGSDALRDALNNTVGSGKYTNYRSGSSYDYRENRLGFSEGWKEKPEYRGWSWNGLPRICWCERE